MRGVRPPILETLTEFEIMAIHSMQDLLVEELRELVDAEKQASRAYPKLMKAVSSERLRKALDEHNNETKEQSERLNQIFEELDIRARGKACEAVRGLIEDAHDLIEKDMPSELLDVAVAAAAQKLAHLEIAAYGSARAHAEALGLDKVAQLLKETLGEEKAIDQRLNEIATQEVNSMAIKGEKAEEEKEEKPEAAAATEEGGEEAEEGEMEEKRQVERAAAGSKPGSSRKKS
jgi:ferritin-like metal-binding protein YciE